MADQRFAVVIGADDAGVQLGLPNLRIAEADARAVRDWLCHPDIGAFDRANVTLFVGDRYTAEEIKNTLRRISDNSDPSDALLVYFAGRTLTPRWSQGTETYLVTPELDEADLFDNPDAGLRMTFLIHRVLEPFAGHTLLILDGAGSHPVAPELGVDMISVNGRGPAYAALMTCVPDDSAREDPVLGHGLLTHHVLRALQGRAVDQDGFVTFQSLSDYVMRQGLDPEPRLVTHATYSQTPLTRPAGRHLRAGRPEAPEPVPLGSPLDQFEAPITRLIRRIARSAEKPVEKVEYLRSALEAESVAYLAYTAADYTVISATEGFRLGDVQQLLPRDDPEWLRHSGGAMLCLPISRAGSQGQLLVVTNPAPHLQAMGELLARILATAWQTDFAGSPAEAEIQTLTNLRETNGRLPARLYERCLRLYREVLESFTIVFQPVVQIGPEPRNVVISSYEALCRRHAADKGAPVAMLRVAHVWGDHFVVERDMIILRKALTAYARAHNEVSAEMPKPVAVNVAVRSLLSDTYVEALRNAITDAGLPGDSVTLEISEQDEIGPRDGEQWPDKPHVYFNKRLAQIARDVEVAFAVDDFGEDRASLSRVVELPLTQIKVDRAVLDHPLALDELALVVKVAQYARDRGETHAPRVVILEGVEVDSQLTLRQIYRQGIKHVQGYITGEPAVTLQPLRLDVRKDIAARVKGDQGPRPARVAQDDEALRRGA